MKPFKKTSRMFRTYNAILKVKNLIRLRKCISPEAYSVALPFIIGKNRRHAAIIASVAESKRILKVLGTLALFHRLMHP